MGKDPRVVHPMRTSPQMVYGLQLLISMLPDNLTGVEIGSYAGESATIFAESGKFKKLICVDMWDPNYYSGQQLIAAEKVFDEVVEKYACIEKMKMNSKHLLKIKDKVDFVYIDGNHKEAFVRRDIQNALELLSRGGCNILAGHDYSYRKSPGVKPAVKDLLKFPDAVFCDYSWVKFIGRLPKTS